MNYPSRHNPGTWQVKTPLGIARSHPATAVYQDKIYVFGGGGPAFKSLNTVEVYDPQGDKWTPRREMPSLRSGAILSTEFFDATTVDPLSITLASAPGKLKGKGKPMTSTQDVNGDGRLDLVVHVETEALQLSETSQQAILKGKTSAGVKIRGSDSVRVIP